MQLFGKINVLKSDFIFYSKSFKDKDYDGKFLALKGSMCKIKAGASDDGASFARDENAVFSWSWHDNSYDDKDLPLTRFQKDLIMLDLLKAEDFRWFRYKWIKKIFKNYKGVPMRHFYFLVVVLFGWIKHK